MGHSMVYCNKCNNFVFYDDNWNPFTHTCEDCAKEINNEELSKTERSMNNV